MATREELDAWQAMDLRRQEQVKNQTVIIDRLLAENEDLRRQLDER